MRKRPNTTVLLVPKLRLLAAIALTLALVACEADTLEPLPLDITMSADKLTTVPADSITFNIKAQGGLLRTIGIEWGDGTSYMVQLGGARTAELNRLRHAYQQSGVYQVSAAVDDAAAGQKTATLSVTIQ
jgi:hypothetical protein